MADETTTHKHTHKEQRRQYTFNKLKAFGQEEGLLEMSSKSEN